MNMLIIVAIAVVVILSGIAAYYLVALARLRAKQSAAKTELDNIRIESQRKNKKSIEILARGLLDGQVSSTEASIRISVLMDSLGLEVNIKERYQVFYQLAKETGHIPILDQWKALSKSEKGRYDKERLSLEEKYHDFLIQSAKDLLVDKDVIG